MPVAIGSSIRLKGRCVRASGRKLESGFRENRRDESAVDRHLLADWAQALYSQPFFRKRQCRMVQEMMISASTA